MVELPITAAEVLDRVTDGFVVLDRELRVLYINEAGQRIGKRSREEILGRSLYELNDDFAGSIYETNYLRALREQVTIEFEEYYAPLDISALIRVHPSPQGLTIYFQDTSERKRAERAIAESEQRYRRIVETAHEGIWLVDADYRTLFTNDRMTEILGLPPGGLAGRRVPEMVFENDRPELARRISERRTGKKDQYDIRLLRSDGSPVWVLARITPILDEDGNFAGALGMISDISERKAFEQKLLEQREWFRVTLSSIGDAVIATDFEGRVTFMNQVAQELTDWRDEDARGRPLDEVFRIVHEETREPVESPVTKVLRLGCVVGLANHTSLIARDGSERPIDDSGAPIRDERGKTIGVVLVFRDNTERRRAEDALREADRRKDEFLAMLAHELRNPLAPIQSALEVMHRHLDQPDRQARARDIVERQVRHMTRLVDDLLDVSRITRGKINLQRTRVDVATVVSRAIESCQPAIQARGQFLMVRLPTERIVLHADATRLAQVISNLLQNASKFTPDGGHISIVAERDNGHVVLRVRDDGMGITEETLPRVFDLFTQGDGAIDRVQNGLGIGLTLVRSLVSLHGGTVEAHSAGPGQGSEFLVRLPLPGEGVAAPDDAVAPARPTLASRRVHVLVVDDNRDAGETLALLLEGEGHRVRVVGDAAAAQRELEREPCDLVFLDIGLPRMSGYELARVLRRDPALSSLRLVALTGYGQEEDRRRSQEAGFDAHLVKPVDLATLARVIAGLLGR